MAASTWDVRLPEQDTRPVRIAGTVNARAAAFDALYHREYANIAGYCYLGLPVADRGDGGGGFVTSTTYSLGVTE